MYLANSHCSSHLSVGPSLKNSNRIIHTMDLITVTTIAVNSLLRTAKMGNA